MGGCANGCPFLKQLIMESTKKTLLQRNTVETVFTQDMTEYLEGFMHNYFNYIDGGEILTYKMSLLLETYVKHYPSIGKYWGYDFTPENMVNFVAGVILMNDMLRYVKSESKVCFWEIGRKGEFQLPDNSNK